MLGLQSTEQGGILLLALLPLFCSVSLTNTLVPPSHPDGSGNCLVTLTDRPGEMDANINAMSKYAGRIGSQFHLVMADQVAGLVGGWEEGWDVRLMKVAVMHQFLTTCNRVIFMDDSIVLPSPDRVPNLFEMVPEDQVGGAPEKKSDIAVWGCDQLHRRQVQKPCGMVVNSGLLVLSQSARGMLQNWRADFMEEWQARNGDKNAAFGGPWAFKDQAYVGAKMSEACGGADNCAFKLPTNFVVQGSDWKKAVKHNDASVIDAACIIHITRGYSQDGLDVRAAEINRLHNEHASLKGAACDVQGGHSPTMLSSTSPTMTAAISMVMGSTWLAMAVMVAGTIAIASGVIATK